MGKEIAKFEGHKGGVYAVTFSPDGQTLASASADGTVLLWNMQGLLVKEPINDVDNKQLTKWWTDLGEKDATAAYKVIWSMEQASDKALAFLKDRLEPISEPDLKRVQRLLANLDDEQFNVRDTARRELAKYGEVIEPALQKALTGKPSPEAAKHLESLLTELKGPTSNPEVLRPMRAIQVLERIRSTEARQLLEKLAKGAPLARQTRDAKAASQRLDQRQKDR